MCKNRGGSPGESYPKICCTADVTSLGKRDLLTFISVATGKLEKQDKFCQSGRSSKVELLKSGCVMSLVTPKALSFFFFLPLQNSLHVYLKPLKTMSSSLDMFLTIDVKRHDSLYHGSMCKIHQALQLHFVS